MKSSLFFHIVSLVWPARCPLCAEITQRRSKPCASCEGQIERITDCCTGCGCPQANCMCSRVSFKLNIAAPLVYDGVVRKGIHAFKFRGEKSSGFFFADEMASAVKARFVGTSFDIVTCVPQTSSRRRKRGYNQSALLAAHCAKLLNSACDERLLVKLRETADQHTLKERERLKNVSGAFALAQGKNVNGKTVLLCDDIKTTGATLNECRKVLLKAGAKEVYCAAAAVRVKKPI